MAANWTPYGTGEITLAKRVLPRLRQGMLCLADRNLFGVKLWEQAQAAGAELLWRVKKNMRLECDRRLPDGSYLSSIDPSERDWRQKTGGIIVRVIDYKLDGVEGAEPICRLVTTIPAHRSAPAKELAALCHERWEIETALDELKTHLRGRKIVLRSKTPDLVRPVFHGLMMAPFAIRGLMYEAALKTDIDPDRLSYLHARRCRPPRTANPGRYSPLSVGKRFMTLCSMRSARSDLSPAAPGATIAG